MPACRYVEVIGSAAMLATKRSAGFTPYMNIREHVTHLPPTSTNKAAHSDFEMSQNRGISGSIKKDLCPPNFFKKYTNDQKAPYLYNGGGSKKHLPEDKAWKDHI